MPDRIDTILRLLSLADSKRDFQARMMNPAYRLEVGLWGFLGFCITAAGLYGAVRSLSGVSLGIPARAMASVSQHSSRLHLRSALPAAAPTSAQGGAAQPTRPKTPVVPVPADVPGVHAPDRARATPPAPVPGRVDLAKAPAVDPTAGRSAEGETAEPFPSPSVHATVTAHELAAGPNTTDPHTAAIIASPARKVFHTRDCPYRPSMTRHPVFFATAAEAGAAGYRPCWLCQRSGNVVEPVPHVAAASGASASAPTATAHQPRHHARRHRRRTVPAAAAGPGEAVASAPSAGLIAVRRVSTLAPPPIRADLVEVP